MSTTKIGKAVHVSISLRLGVQDAEDEGASDAARGGDGVDGKEKVEEHGTNVSSLGCHAENLDLLPVREAVLTASPQHQPGGLPGVTAQFSKS